MNPIGGRYDDKVFTKVFFTFHRLNGGSINWNATSKQWFE
jgi:hypothetical protein